MFLSVILLLVFCSLYYWWFVTIHVFVAFLLLLFLYIFLLLVTFSIWYFVVFNVVTFSIGVVFSLVAAFAVVVVVVAKEVILVKWSGWSDWALHVVTSQRLSSHHLRRCRRRRSVKDVLTSSPELQGQREEVETVAETKQRKMGRNGRVRERTERET